MRSRVDMMGPVGKPTEHVLMRLRGDCLSWSSSWGKVYVNPYRAYPGPLPAPRSTLEPPATATLTGGMGRRLPHQAF